MRQTSAQDRERAVQAITRRNMLERRIKRSQRRIASLQGEARQALEDSLAADQAALAEMVPALDAVKAVMRQEEEHVRRKTQEAIRLRAEWRSRQSPPYPNSSVPASPGRILGFLAALVAMVTAAVLLLDR